MKKYIFIPLVLFFCGLGGGILLYQMEIKYQEILKEEETMKLYYEKMSPQLGSFSEIIQVRENLKKEITLLEAKKEHNEHLQTVVNYFCDFDNSSYYLWEVEIDESKKEIRKIYVGFTSDDIGKGVNIKK